LNTRREVCWFAEKMETVLQENDYKGGWKDCNINWLFRRLVDEVFELAIALSKVNQHAWNNPLNTTAKSDVVKEAVDIANFAMMIADLAKENDSERRGGVGEK